MSYEPDGYHDDEDFLDYDVDELLHETDKAWLLKVEGQEIWFPKSRCNYDDADDCISVPVWLAKQKGLV